MVSMLHVGISGIPGLCFSGFLLLCQIPIETVCGATRIAFTEELECTLYIPAWLAGKSVDEVDNSFAPREFGPLRS